jgi:hypothetical protein
VHLRETFRVDLLFSGRGRFHCCLFILVSVNVLSVELFSIKQIISFNTNVVMRKHAKSEVPQELFKGE